MENAAYFQWAYLKSVSGTHSTCWEVLIKSCSIKLFCSLLSSMEEMTNGLKAMFLPLTLRQHKSFWAPHTPLGGAKFGFWEPYCSLHITAQIIFTKLLDQSSKCLWYSIAWAYRDCQSVAWLGQKISFQMVIAAMRHISARATSMHLLMNRNWELDMLWLQIRSLQEEPTLCLLLQIKKYGVHPCLCPCCTGKSASKSKSIGNCFLLTAGRAVGRIWSPDLVCINFSIPFIGMTCICKIWKLVNAQPSSKA